MEIIFWLFILFALVYEPIIGYFGFKRFERRLEVSSDARVRYYTYVMVGLWVPTIVIIALTFFTELSFSDIGIAIPTINTETLGPIATYITLIVGALYFILLLYYIVSYFVSKEFREKLTASKKRQYDGKSVAALLPVTKKEKVTWTYVSLTAGITEEIIYRGFLIFAIAFLFPNLSIWIVMLLASLLFGLAHSYQGIGDVVRTTIIGYLFSIIYIGLGSIIPLIILHFVVDYIAKLGDEEEAQIG